MAERGTPGRTRRRATLVGGGVATAAVIGSVVAVPLLTASDGGAPASAPEQKAVPVNIRVGADQYGVGFGMRTSFDEDLTLSRPTLVVGDSRSKADLWPIDGDDHEGEDLDPLILPKGTPVTIEGGMNPACDDGATPEAVFEVRVRDGSGTDQVRRFTSRRPGILAEPTKKWCSMDPQVSPGGGSLSADGDAKADVTVRNPGPDPIVVEVPAFSQGGATWYAASATVPPGEPVEFVVKGSGVRYDGTQELPWEDGRLLIDGKSFKLPKAEDGWLG